jgi:SAM-dependent methyltransferase
MSGSFLKGVKKFAKRMTQSNSNSFKAGKKPASFTNTQRSFILWNAERLGISEEDSEKRYISSWSAIEGGHSGKTFRLFNDLSYNLFNVFYSDVGDEIYTSYERHSYMHFLRMLSYVEPQWKSDDLVIKHLQKYSKIDIVDYGCGLAQRSRSLAKYLKSEGKDVRLFLADIPTVRKEFLLWLGKESGIETKFLDCTVSSPIPKLPECDVCIITEFFEHVYNPLKYFDEVNSALRKDGLLLTNISDHKKEFMHVSPNLKPLRDKVEELNYETIENNRILKKTY